MRNVLLNAIFPHPPIIIPEVGRESLPEAEKTVQGAENLAKEVIKAQPETLVIITPHGPIFQDALILWGMESLEGNFAGFRAPEVKLSFFNDLELVEKIVEQSHLANIPAVKFGEELAERYDLDISLDHGVLVPLYYLQRAGFQGKIVVISIGLLPFVELYAFGRAIREAVSKLNRRAAIITSGDLSHSLTSDAPAGYQPEGKVVDEKIVAAIKEARPEDLINLDPVMIEKAGECGLRPIIIGLGSLDGWQTENRVLSYEGPFGVGYMTALIKPQREEEGSRLLEKLFALRQQEIEERRKQEGPLVLLARQTVESYARNGEIPKIDLDLPAQLPNQAGVFVSIKKHGELRGCIGTTAPTRNSLRDEVVYNAISAAFQDPRFSPVEEEELGDLVYSVDVLGVPEPVESLTQLNAQKYGVIVRKGRNSGLLLPDLEGVNTVEEQVNIAKRKAGIALDEEVELLRFTVERYK